jgi:hypothetical protein
VRHVTALAALCTTVIQINILAELANAPFALVRVAPARAAPYWCGT